MLTEEQKGLISFPFTRAPLITEHTEAFPVGVPSGLDAVVNNLDSKVLGVIPAGNFIVPHLEAVERVERALTEANVETDPAKLELLRNGARMFVHYRLKGFTKEVLTKDDIIPELILRNGYDDKTPFGIEWGLFRVLCANGMRIQIAGQRAARTTMGEIDVKMIMSTIEQFTGTAFLALVTRIQEMAAKVSSNMLPETRDWFVERVTNNLVQEYDSQVADIEGLGQGINQWQLFNVVTNVITYKVNSYTRRRHLEMQAAKHFNFHATLKKAA